MNIILVLGRQVWIAPKQTSFWFVTFVIMIIIYHHHHHHHYYYLQE